MMYNEFLSRTGVEVTPTEWDDIQRAYNRSCDDKDAFCKAWRKANAERVAEAKRKAKERKERSLRLEKLWAVEDHLRSVSNRGCWDAPAAKHLGKRMLAVLAANRIEVEREIYGHTELISVRALIYDIKFKARELAR